MDNLECLWDVKENLVRLIICPYPTAKPLLHRRMRSKIARAPRSSRPFSVVSPPWCDTFADRIHPWTSLNYRSVPITGRTEPHVDTLDHYSAVIYDTNGSF